MKTKFYWVALLASAALITQANAGGYHGSGGHFAGYASGAARGGSARSFHSMPMRSFGGARMIHSSQRFSSLGRYSSTAGFRQYYVNSNRGTYLRAPQFNRGNINRGDGFSRFSNGGNRAIANMRREGNGAGQVRSRNNLPANWRSHVVAQHSANWHSGWDRSRDHRWNGHDCRFINGSWVIFDFGFYPGSYWYRDDYYYPYYYADPYGYDPGYDESGAYQAEEYDDHTGPAGQSNDSTITADAQAQLARRGYYRGGIDGTLGPATRRAIMRYQSDHGLSVTGRLNRDMLHALGLARVASN